MARFNKSFANYFDFFIRVLFCMHTILIKFETLKNKLMKPEETIDFHLRWTWQKFSKFYNAEAAKHHLSMAIGYILLNIDSKEGTPSTSLGPKMGMEPKSLSRTLKSMEKNGLIERRKDSNDGRITKIYLTQKGIEKRNISRNTVLNLNQNLQSKFSSQELNTFFEMMNKLKNIDFKLI